jgi:hypothetical protein
LTPIAPYCSASAIRFAWRLVARTVAPALRAI